MQSVLCEFFLQNETVISASSIFLRFNINVELTASFVNFFRTPCAERLLCKANPVLLLWVLFCIVVFFLPKFEICHHCHLLKMWHLVFVYIFKELLFVVLQKIYDIMCLWFDVLISALHMLFACLFCVLFHLSFFHFFLNYLLPYSSFPLRIDLLHFQKGSTLIGELVYSVQLLFSFHHY